jgi:hypothetical protein
MHNVGDALTSPASRSPNFGSIENLAPIVLHQPGRLIKCCPWQPFQRRSVMDSGFTTHCPCWGSGLSLYDAAPAAIYFAVEKFFQHDGLVVLCIFGAVNQRQGSATR